MKKICNGHFMSPFNTDDKTFRIMRLTFIALFVFSFSLLASVHLMYLQPIITQYFIDNKSEIWLLFLIAHSKR